MYSIRRGALVGTPGRVCMDLNDRLCYLESVDYVLNLLTRKSYLISIVDKSKSGQDFWDGRHEWSK